MPETANFRPYFLPENVAFESLPTALQAVAMAVLDPIYKELVLGAADPLERDAAKTLVHLGWLEVLGEIELGHQMVGDEKLFGSEEHYKLIERLLRVVSAKSKLHGFLLNVRKLRKPEGGQLRPGGEAMNGLSEAPESPAKPRSRKNTKTLPKK